MSLAGSAVKIQWCNVDDADKDRFYKWHNGEHMIERINVPGFKRGRRSRAIKGDREYLILYEVENFDVLVGTAYQHRLANPTELTQATEVVRDRVTAVSRVAASVGAGQGGFLWTLRFDAEPGREKELQRFIAHDVLPELVDMGQIVGGHLLIADREASEKRRPGRPHVPVPYWAIVVEGVNAEGLEAAADRALEDSALARHGGKGPFVRSLFRPEFTVAPIHGWHL